MNGFGCLQCHRYSWSDLQPMCDGRPFAEIASGQRQCQRLPCPGANVIHAVPPAPGMIPEWLRRRIAICEGDDQREECDHWRGQPIMRCAKRGNCSPCYRAKLHNHCPLRKW